MLSERWRSHNNSHDLCNNRLYSPTHEITRRNRRGFDGVAGLAKIDRSSIMVSIAGIQGSPAASVGVESC